MDFNTAKKFIDILFDLDAQHSEYVNEDEAFAIILDFIGGEPFLEIDLMDQIMDYFLEKAIGLNHRWAMHHYISISTNGWDYFNPKVERFIKKHYGRVSVGVTVDGNKQLHDSCRLTADGQPTYDRAAAAFKDARERFNQDGTKLTIARANLPYLFEAARDIITDFDLKELHANPVFEEEWNNDDANLYYYQLKQLADWMISSGRYKITHTAFFRDYDGHPIDPNDDQNFCGGTGKMLALDVDGKIYPCMRYSPISIGEEKSKPWVIGTTDTGLFATAQQLDTMHCLDCVTRSSQSTEECFNCPIGSGCAWCSAWNCELYGTPNKRCTRICPMHKARVLATAYYLNTLYAMGENDEKYSLDIPEKWAVEIIGQEEYDMIKNL